MDTTGRSSVLKRNRRTCRDFLPGRPPPARRGIPVLSGKPWIPCFEVALSSSRLDTWCTSPSLTNSTGGSIMCPCRCIWRCGTSISDCGSSSTIRSPALATPTRGGSAMKRILGIVMGGALVLGLGISSPAMAQRNGMGFFHAPVFVAQPGIVHNLATGASTEFLARFVTAIPLSIERTTLVAIIQWTPFADNGRGGKANSPAFVYGPVVNVLNQKYWSFDVDGLFAYGPAATGNSDYTHKFLVEGDFYLKLGSILNAKSNWNGL